MNWEAVNGITGIVSAVAAVVSFIQVRPGQKDENLNRKEKSFYHFILTCSGWTLCVLCWIWIFRPFGPYMTDHEQKTALGIALSFPAVAIFVFGLRKLRA